MIFTLELTLTDFQDVAVCLGHQLNTIIGIANDAYPGLTWMCGDVQPAPIGSALNSSPSLKHIDSTTLARGIESVSQFLRGVFVGSVSSQEINLEEALDSELLEALLKAESFVQIHCFDTTFFWVATDTECVFQALQEKFKKG